MTEDDFNAIAWRDFVMFAWNEPEARAAFTRATGVTIPRAASPIEALVNDASGALASALTQFVEWVTRTQWGIEYAPKAYRDSLAALPIPSSSFEVAEGAVRERWIRG